MATIVDGELYKKLDGQLEEIKRQLRQKGGFPYDPQLLVLGLQAIIEGRFEALGSLFPSERLVPDLIPKGWKVLEDIEPTANLDVGKLKFRSFLKDGESYIGGDEMRKRAITLGGNLGLCDAPRILADQVKIPANLRDCYIVLPGTKLRASGGDLRVASLYWDGSRWLLSFLWLAAASTAALALRAASKKLWSLGLSALSCRLSGPRFLRPSFRRSLEKVDVRSEGLLFYEIFCYTKSRFYRHCPD